MQIRPCDKGRARDEGDADGRLYKGKKRRGNPSCTGPSDEADMEHSFTCPKCGEVFSKREGLQRKAHLKEQHGVYLEWRCAQCTYLVPSRRLHDLQKHWESKHFGEAEPPVPQLQPINPPRRSRSPRRHRSSTSKSPSQPRRRESSSAERQPRAAERRCKAVNPPAQTRRQRGPASSPLPRRRYRPAARQPRRDEQPRRVKPRASASLGKAPVDDSPADSKPGELEDSSPVLAPRGDGPPTAPSTQRSQQPPATAVEEREAGRGDHQASTRDQANADLAPTPGTSAGKSQAPAAQPRRRKQDAPVSQPQPTATVTAPSTSTGVCVCLEDRDGDVVSVDLHAVCETSFDTEPVETVQPEAPITLSQVQTWFKYQASEEDKACVLREFGGGGAAEPATPTVPQPKAEKRHKRTQVDLRPLHRDNATQAQLRPRVTHLPAGGIAIDSAEFSFRHIGAVSESALEFAD